MASSRAYLDFVLDQLSGLENITYRGMMREFILYDRCRIFGGIYDDRLLVKDVPAARKLLPQAVLESPYEGAKPMLLVDEIDNRERLQDLVQAMYSELPEPKRKISQCQDLNSSDLKSEG